MIPGSTRNRTTGSRRSSSPAASCAAWSNPFCRAGTSQACPSLLNPADLDGIELLEQALLAHAPAARDGASRLLLTVAAWRCHGTGTATPACCARCSTTCSATRSNSRMPARSCWRPLASADGDCPPGTLRLAVVDTGPGIDAALGRRMFRAYERGPDQIRDAAPGYGLGLFICRRIVHAMGGTIGWSSPAAGGARFEVTLPEVLRPARAGRPACRPASCAPLNAALTCGVPLRSRWRAA